MEDIIQKSKVLLLSATPLNNELKDLRNQIMFITGNDGAAFSNDNKDGLGINSITGLIKI